MIAVKARVSGAVSNPTANMGISTFGYSSYIS
jgi:hypothetical protein